MHDSFEQVHFRELVKSIHQIELNGRKQFKARAAQICKLLNQNTLWGAWQSLRLKMSHNGGVSDPMMNELIQCSSSSNTHWTDFDLDQRPMGRWYVNAWTKHLNEGVKLMFIWFLIVYVKRWADED